MKQPNVTKYTRAGREGKCIECPDCQNQAVVWHFAWSALTCSECETSYPKYEWKIASCELDDDGVELENVTDDWYDEEGNLIP